MSIAAGMMSGEVAIRVVIEGRVQGVWYRGWMVDQADDLGVRGWVRNRRDGTVEALLAGAEGAVRRMIELCWEGPPLARVERITEVVEEGPVGPGFRQLPTA